MLPASRSFYDFEVAPVLTWDKKKIAQVTSPGPDHLGGQGPEAVPWLTEPCSSDLNASSVQTVGRGV
jgi:hypothetical protein